uniref:Uncharacterized protein n=1 Tax=viral metagenome TaxID=1070528 RepID=A0A6C0BNP8_9ZZZZ
MEKFIDHAIVAVFTFNRENPYMHQPHVYDLQSQLVKDLVTLRNSLRKLPEQEHREYVSKRLNSFMITYTMCPYSDFVYSLVLGLPT